MRAFLKRWLLRTWAGRIPLMPLRFYKAARYYHKPLRNLLFWTAHSREVGNFTYPLTPKNARDLAHTISAVTGSDIAEVSRYLLEIQTDERLKQHIISGIKASSYRHVSEETGELGRRIGWYAFVRILKPRIVVETGVDKGHGAVTLCAAILKNAEEGFPGRYFGTDKDAGAGFLLTPPYSEVGTILYGDSLKSLATIPSIDLFINDSDHSDEYEAAEYVAILPKLSSPAIILGDNSHESEQLAQFSARHGRRFIFFREQPLNHWYPGAGIGISYSKNQS